MVTQDSMNVSEVRIDQQLKIQAETTVRLSHGKISNIELNLYGIQSRTEGTEENDYPSLVVQRGLDKPFEESLARVKRMITEGEPNSEITSSEYRQWVWDVSQAFLDVSVYARRCASIVDRNSAYRGDRDIYEWANHGKIEASNQAIFWRDLYISLEKSVAEQNQTTE